MSNEQQQAAGELPAPMTATTTAGVRVNDRRKIGREATAEETAEEAQHRAPRRVSDFWHPPAHIHGLIVPVSGQVTIDAATGFMATCTKGWAAQAARRFPSFRSALGLYTGRSGTVSHILTFDRVADERSKHGYAPAHGKPIEPDISMQGDANRRLSYHVLTLPVRGLDDADMDRELIARSMRRLMNVLLDQVPSLRLVVPPPEPGAPPRQPRYWMPILKDKKTSWEQIRAVVEPYLDDRIELIATSNGSLNG